MKDRHSRKLNGTVLVMVVTVMCVLIIMLVATLSVVTTANRRIYTRYEENQAYYTARSVMDIFVQHMMLDKDYLSDRNYVADGYAAGAKQSQGLALQLDLYDLTAPGDGTITYRDDILHNAKQNDLATGSLPSGTSFTRNTAYLNNLFGTKSTNNKIVYEITGFPMVGGASANDYSAMIDCESGNLSKPADATITVEVMERNYNYVLDDGTTLKTDTADHDKFYACTPQQQLLAILRAPREEDYVKVKITVETKYRGLLGKEVAVVKSNDGVPVVIPNVPQTQFDDALKALGGIVGGGGAQVNVAGGTTQMDPAVTTQIDGNHMMGNVFSVGKLMWTSSASYQLRDGESVVSNSGLSIHEAIPTSWGVNEVDTNTVNLTPLGNASNTYMFLNGDAPIYNNMNMNGVPLIANHLWPMRNDTKISNAYITTLDMRPYTDAWGNTSNGKLGVESSSAKIYVGTLVVPDGCITDNAVNLSSLQMPMNNIVFCSGFRIIDATQYDKETNPSADPFAEGHIVDINNLGFIDSFTAPGGEAFDLASHYNTSVKTLDMNAGGLEYEGESKYGQGGYKIVKDDTGLKWYKRYEVPFTVNGKSYIDVPTVQSQFYSYFKDGSFNESTGELKNISESAPESQRYSTTNIQNRMVSPVDMLLVSAKDNSGDNAPTTIAEAITAYSASPLPSSGTITLTNDNQYFYLDPYTTYTGDLTVTGSGSGKVIILGKEGPSTTFKFDNFRLWTDDINNSTTSIVNSDSGTKAPPVEFYIGNGAKVQTRNQCTICGYIAMPGATLDSEQGKLNGVSYTNGSDSPQSFGQVTFVGAVLCGNFKSQNGNVGGVLFVDPKSGGGGGGGGGGALPNGDPILDWGVLQYVRS